jgi:hypothetical protein
VATVTEREGATLEDALRPAVAARVTGEAGYAFGHELFREAVVRDLLPGGRAPAHRAFAEAVQCPRPLGPAGPGSAESGTGPDDGTSNLRDFCLFVAYVRHWRKTKG